MICRNCLRVLARPHITKLSPVNYPSRLLSTTHTLRNPTPPPPPTPSLSSAQPLSDPTATTKKDVAPEPVKKAHPTVKSSVPAGTPLKGLNFLKNQTDPLAMEDSEYPPWLWDVLKKKDKGGEAGGEGDLFSKSKKQRRLAAKRLRKEQLANPGMLVPKIPIYEQTIDLPAGDGTVEGATKALEARNVLTKAMRDKRRAGIKEGNFLKSMG